MTTAHRISCRQCGLEVITRAHNTLYCSDKCRKRYERSYNAGSIKIEEHHDDPRLDWALAERWALDYRTPHEWIYRAIQACRDVGVCPSYVKARYLDKDGTPLNKAVDAARRGFYEL